MDHRRRLTARPNGKGQSQLKSNFAGPPTIGNWNGRRGKRRGMIRSGQIVPDCGRVAD